MITLPRMSLTEKLSQIRTRRLALGLAQGELADLAGINRVQLNGLERGRSTNPTIGTLDAIERALETAEALAAGREPAAPPRPGRRAGTQRPPAAHTEPQDRPDTRRALRARIARIRQKLAGMR